VIAYPKVPHQSHSLTAEDTYPDQLCGPDDIHDSQWPLAQRRRPPYDEVMEGSEPARPDQFGATEGLEAC